MGQFERRTMIDPHQLNEHLPIGVIVIDATGIIVHANRRAIDMTGAAPNDTVGRPIMDFVDERDRAFLADSLAAAPTYGRDLMGPARMRYCSLDGESRWTEYWAHRCPASFGFEGYIVTLSTESVTDSLANAAYQIASDEPLVETLESIARAAAGYPLLATGAFLVPRLRAGGGRTFDPVGPWPPALTAIIDDKEMPWHEVAITGEPRDLAVSDLPAEAADAAAAAGFGSLWIRSVVTQGSHVAAVFVAWRHQPGDISPNQNRHLAETIGVARLGFDHDEHRRQLERAALFDQLTGLGNRSLLARDLAGTGTAGVTVMYIDLDGFKAVNDEHGHDVGDLVLAAAAQRLRSVMREKDSVYRIGGDEFIVLCDGVDGVREGERDVTAAIADRIVDALTTPFRIGSSTIQTGASVGVAHRRPGEHTTDIVRRADHALLEAKRAGKARWHLANAQGR